MDNQKIIIILLIIIIAILAVGLGVMLTGDFNKQECKLTVKCNKTMSNGDSVIIKLTDLNKTPIKNANITIKLTSKNTTKEYNATTNEKGKATLKLSNMDDGKYTVNCTFDGNDKYKATTAEKKFSYTDEIVASGGSSSDSSSSSSVDPIDANRPTNDPNYKGYTPLHESEVTNDGWNPREHEVSRKNMADGSQEIRYDDGYYRLVDENGYVITYGYK
ncbi:MAG: carboxypeptidase regulatory-like domain-containing protein [Methanobrevibacter sp.]|jgi:hypothetical protein|uniref:carboxypeptidase-like regulatory domain-containing protein n=1 Tax=Methanobrevibacter sp. TaxID=66852 RepID=UPI0025F6D1A3|nr:carboxypeptidase-like regulatory domain-containing protein [Methanobrevibacter sp.]MBE6498636.1 carboxypeptidase regulatory-like domain-containing protein [Methanobrevibacter sp.]